MAIEAPVSTFKKNNIKIGIAVLVVLGGWFFYDGKFSEKFQEKHTDDGTPDSTLVFNRNAPPYFIGGAVLLGVYLFSIWNKKVVADDNALVTSRQSIPYGSIEKIDKTHFESKGYFVITYKDDQDKEMQLKLSDGTYDNLQAILDELVAKIS